LLLHGREIERIADEVARERLALVPLSFYFKDGRVKVELALARGRRKATSATRWPSATRSATCSGRWVARPRVAPTDSQSVMTSSAALACSAIISGVTASSPGSSTMNAVPP
jgi:hypothetical protein